MTDSYWYNLRTGQVEHGTQSSVLDLAGPFETAEEAARAPEILKKRADAWEEDERRDAEWKD
ncbi:hypothetical protein GCM10010910_03330 [Microbacterium nanhaiense]|uniref:SPOR domain-containing protein n=1 Tax=Microbacterium nanhaiense TaxID=1301026 RepID=A0ABQ2MX57_9MICO|nr:SPOR domain-containing protein [Microbacterium nanhaiense]GGO59709.1 hypothetical protein GCM10010910_03330 [Microbacterium nanhaiense]